MMGLGDCRQERGVLRGGSWNNNGRNLRSAARNNWHDANDNNGFRLARIHDGAGWPTRTRQHPDACAAYRRKKRDCRGVSRGLESHPAITFVNTTCQ